MLERSMVSAWRGLVARRGIRYLMSASAAKVFTPRILGASAFVAGGAGLFMWNSDPASRRSHVAVCEAEKPPAMDAAQIRNQFRYMFSDAVEKAAPGVVQIRCVKEDGWFSYESSGSGFVFDKDGSIMTNAHVVQGARTVSVKLSDGTEIEARVENFDVLSDIAILRPAQKPPRFTPVAIGKSSELRVGEWVLVCGSPGSLQDSVSVGVVSALGRRSAELGMGARRMSYIQTDAAINQGNSGGPVVNLAGEVVGMSSMKAAQLEGIGFAIPIDLGMEIVRQLRAHGRVLRPYLGIKVLTLGEGDKAELERQYGVRLQHKGGVYVAGVGARSPAAKAGLQEGDLLTEMDGSPLIDAGQVHLLLGEEVGKEVLLRGIRIAGRGRAAPFAVKLVTAAAPKA